MIPAKVIQLHNTDASRFGHTMLCKGQSVTRSRCKPLWSHYACKGHSVTQYRCKPLWSRYALQRSFGHSMPMHTALVTRCLQRSFGYTIPMQAPLVTLCSAKVIRLHNTDASPFGYTMLCKGHSVTQCRCNRYRLTMPTMPCPRMGGEEPRVQYDSLSKVIILHLWQGQLDNHLL